MAKYDNGTNILERIASLLNSMQDGNVGPTLAEGISRETTGSSSVLAGWKSLAIINQGTTTITVNTIPLLPGSTVSWDLKGTKGVGLVKALVLPAGSDVLITELR